MASSVAELCKVKGLDLSGLAAGSGMEERRVEAILEGRWTPSPTERQRIADTLGVTVDEIAWGHVTPIQHLYGHGPG